MNGIDVKIIISNNQSNKEILKLVSSDGVPHVKFDVKFNSLNENLLGFYRGSAILYNVPVSLLKYRQGQNEDYRIDVYIKPSIFIDYEKYILLFSAMYIEPIQTGNINLIETSFKILLSPTSSFYTEEVNFKFKKTDTINNIINSIFKDMRVLKEGSSLEYSKVINEAVSFKTRVDALKYINKSGFMFFNTLWQDLSLADVRSSSRDVIIFTDKDYQKLSSEGGKFSFLKQFSTKELKYYTIPRYLGIYTQFSSQLENSWETLVPFPYALNYDIGDWVKFVNESGQKAIARIIVSNILIDTRGVSYKNFLLRGEYIDS